MLFSNRKNPETEQKHSRKVQIQLCYHIKSVDRELTTYNNLNNCVVFVFRCPIDVERFSRLHWIRFKSTALTHISLFIVAVKENLLITMEESVLFSRISDRKTWTSKDKSNWNQFEISQNDLNRLINWNDYWYSLCKVHSLMLNTVPTIYFCGEPELFRRMHFP